MQAVLAQRFALKCHFQTRELPVYNIVVAKNRGKAQATPAESSARHFNWNGETRWTALVSTSSALANMLSQALGRTVIDKTGLSGIYDLKLNWSLDPDPGSSASAAAEPSAPTIFTALEQQLGFRLESSKGPIPVLVIDSIDRPMEN